MKSFTIRIWKYASVWFSQFCTKKEREQGSNEISRGQVTRRQRPTTYYKTFQLSLTKKAVREAAANLVVDTVWSDRFKWKSIQRAITDINRKRGTLVSTLKSVWNSIKWGREHWSLWKQQLKALKLSSSKTDLRVYDPYFIPLWYVTFHEQRKCGYGFPSLPLAMCASADVSECF